MSSLAAGSPPQLDSANLLAIKEAFRAFGDDIDAGLDLLLRNAHQDCEFRPYIGDGQVIRGPESIRRYYDEARAAGTEMSINPTSFHEVGDEVIVHGSIRVARPSGGFSESQLSWTFTFRDGRLASAGWGPRQAV
jgi:hypothetical protein